MQRTSCAGCSDVDRNRGPEGQHGSPGANSDEHRCNRQNALRGLQIVLCGGTPRLGGEPVRKGSADSGCNTWIFLTGACKLISSVASRVPPELPPPSAAHALEASHLRRPKPSIICTWEHARDGISRWGVASAHRGYHPSSARSHPAAAVAPADHIPTAPWKRVDRGVSTPSFFKLRVEQLGRLGATTIPYEVAGVQGGVCAAAGPPSTATTARAVAGPPRRIRQRQKCPRPAVSHFAEDGCGATPPNTHRIRDRFAAKFNLSGNACKRGASRGKCSEALVAPHRTSRGPRKPSSGGYPARASNVTLPAAPTHSTASTSVRPTQSHLAA